MPAFRILLFKILFALRAGHWLLRKNRKNKKVPILIFHKINAAQDAVWPAIHPDLFEEIICLLKKEYTILPLHALQSFASQDLSNACFITFDDSYSDFLSFAYPVLKKHAVPSTLFLLPQDMERGYTWTTLIILFVKHYSLQEINAFFKSHDQEIDFGSTPTPFSINLSVTKHVCSLKHSEHQMIMKHVEEKLFGDNIFPERELLTFEELRQLDPQLIDLGSHSLTHPSFQFETDEDFINYELKNSKMIIETELKKEASLFAFPFAMSNPLSQAIAKKQYQLCFEGMNEAVDLKKLKNDDEYRYHLPRFNVHHSSAREVFLLINGFHRLFKR